MEQTQALFNAMSTQDLAAYVACPQEFQEHFEQVMLEKYNIVGSEVTEPLGV